MFLRFSFAVFVACGLLAAGCEKKSNTPPTGAPPAAGGAAPAPTKPTETAAAGATVLDPATVQNGGTVSGAVRIAGSVPAPTPVDMTQKPECVNIHQGKTPPKDALIVGPDNGLKDAFVYIKKGLENYKFNVPAEPAVIDQKGCMYSPHIFGVMVNQDLKVLNSDPTSHNVKCDEAKFNLGMTAQQAPETKKQFFKKEGLGVTFQCEIHPWMRAYACVSKHPYFAVTGENGKFEIKNLPPGKYTLSVWHEPLRTLTNPAQPDVEVEVKAGETKTVEWTYNYKG